MAMDNHRPLDMSVALNIEDAKQNAEQNIEREDRKIEEPYNRQRFDRQAISMMQDHSDTENIGGLFNGHTENRPLKIDLRQGGAFA